MPYRQRTQHIFNSLCLFYSFWQPSELPQAASFSKKLLSMSPGNSYRMFLVWCRLREAELMFQEDRVADADRLLRTVVRKNPTYAGIAAYAIMLVGCINMHCCCYTCCQNRNPHTDALKTVLYMPELWERHVLI